MIAKAVGRAAAAPAVASELVEGPPLPFWGLMFFTFILFMMPQQWVPLLQTLRIAMLSAGIALAVYVLDRCRGDRPLAIMVPAVRLLVIFTMLAAFSIPFSAWPGGAFATFTEFVKSVLIFFLVANTLDSVRRVKWMIGSMMLWSVFMAQRAVRDYASGNLAVGGVRIYGYESPLTANPNDLALLLNLVLALATGLYFASSDRRARAVLLGAMALMVAAVIATFSRGGFLTLLTLGTTLTIARVKERGPGILVWVLIGVILIVALMPAGYGQRVYSILNTKADDTGSAEARWNLMVLAWTAMLTNPLTGVGLGQHGLAFLKQTGHWQWSGVHNVYLEIGADLGIVSLVVYLLAVWHLLKDLSRSLDNLRALPDTGVLLALGTGIRTALIAFLVAAFFHPVAYHFYFFYIAGFAVAFGELARRRAGLTLRAVPA